SSPVEDFQPDFQEEDEHDNLDRTAEQADQQIVKLGFGSLGPLFQPDAGEDVEQLGNAKREEDVNERGEILPQRNSRWPLVVQDLDLVQSERQLVFNNNGTAPSHLGGVRRRAARGGVGREDRVRLRLGPRGPKQQRDQGKNITAENQIELSFHPAFNKRNPSPC